ncbi:phage gp6-like head-tail connector protein [Kribbella catacumbae]|uniref:phage gp6-like head-tail connector protein n=1 Tax=Kribbella catacumbae TaxID=460086 RepID=UPI00036B6BA1|nr:phage gp6-like head-tail connector protein [Kribbella catacumbae]
MAWAPNYVTDGELKAYLRIGDTVDDAEVGFANAAASRAVDRATNRQFGLVAAAQARKYTARWDKDRARYVIDIDDLMTALGLVVTGENGAVDVFAKQPSNADLNGVPWTLLVVDPTSTTLPTLKEDAVTVTAQFGWTTVPVAVKQATLLQASRFFTRRQAPFGVAGSPELGSELRLLAKVDPDVAVVLGPYIRWWAAA